MSVESILKIAVEDAPFQRFAAMWKTYESEVKKQPELWAKIGKQHRELATQWGKVASTFSQTLDNLEQANNALSDQEKHLTLSERLWTNMEKSTRGVASNILGVTGSLLKWTGIASGISGLLGYFSLHGLDRLGSTASSWRQSAMGLGVSTGQQRAFNIAFERLLPGHTEGFLSGVNAMVSNISAQSPLYRIGVNPNGSTADVAIGTMKALRRIATETPTNQLGIAEQMYGLQAFGVGVEDLRRFKSMSGAEFNQVLGTYGKEAGILNLNDRTTLAWQNFVTTMDNAKAQIENVFVKALVPLAPSIAHLATAFGTLLTKATGKDGAITAAIDDLARWLNSFTGKVSKPEFISKVEQFTSDLGGLATAFHDIAHPLDAITDINKATLGVGWNPINWVRNLNYGAELSWLDRKHGLPAGLLETVRSIESGTSFSPAVSSKGAMGIFQLMPSVARTLGVDPNNPDDAAKGAAMLLDHLAYKYNGDVGKMLAAYDWGEGNLDKLLKRNPEHWQSALPRETSDYIAKAAKLLKPYGSVNITLTNKTGADVNMTVSGLGASQ